MSCIHNDEYHLMLVEDVIDSVVYGICITLMMNLGRIVLLTPPFLITHPLSRRKRALLFVYGFALAALASTFYLPFIIGRAAASDSYLVVKKPELPEEIDHVIDLYSEKRLWDPERSNWARNTWLSFGINDVLCSLLLEYLVFLTWRENAYLIGSTLVLLLTRLIGSPPLFETTILIVSIINLFLPRLKRSFSEIPYLPLSSSDSVTITDVDVGDDVTDPKDGVSKPSPVLVFVVTAIFALTSYTDTLLRFTGVLERQEVQFWGTVTFFSSFFIQAIVLIYWSEGGIMYPRQNERLIRLPSEIGSIDEGSRNED